MARDRNEIIQGILQPGETIVLTGKRGGGKTATAVSIAQHAIDGDYGHRNVRVITNVIFGQVRGGGRPPVEAYPPGVIHEDTLAGTMRRVGEILEETDGDCLIIWLLDESQNFMLADMNGSKENMALTKYLGNARKFGVCNLFLTPALNNLTPRVRCFPTGEAKSGYCSCQMRKDPAHAKTKVPAGMDPKCVTFTRCAAEEREVPIVIRPTRWITDIYARGAKPGTFGYDTRSTATFSVGENEHGIQFKFEDFIKATSGGLSHELPAKIREFFLKWDAEGSDNEEGEALPGVDYIALRTSEQMRRMERMERMELTSRQYSRIVRPVIEQLYPNRKAFSEAWSKVQLTPLPFVEITLDQMALIEGEPASTLQSRRSVWLKKLNERNEGACAPSYTTYREELEGPAGARLRSVEGRGDRENEAEREADENEQEDAGGPAEGEPQICTQTPGVACTADDPRHGSTAAAAEEGAAGDDGAAAEVRGQDAEDKERGDAAGRGKEREE